MTTFLKPLCAAVLLSCLAVTAAEAAGKFGSMLDQAPVSPPSVGGGIGSGGGGGGFSGGAQMGGGAQAGGGGFSGGNGGGGNRGNFRGGYRGGYGDYYGGGFYGGGLYGGGFYSGFGSRYGFYDPFWWPYPTYPYGYAYYPTTRVIVRDRVREREPDYLPPPEGPAPAASWYYCRNPEGYYPYVRTCDGAWQAVPVDPSAAPPPG